MAVKRKRSDEQKLVLSIVGNNIKEKREEQGLSLAQMAVICNLSASESQRKRENGKVDIPISCLVDYARIFDCEIVDFFDYEPQDLVT